MLGLGLDAGRPAAVSSAAAHSALPRSTWLGLGLGLGLGVGVGFGLGFALTPTQHLGTQRQAARCGGRLVGRSPQHLDARLHHRLVLGDVLPPN